MSPDDADPRCLPDETRGLAEATTHRDCKPEALVTPPTEVMPDATPVRPSPAAASEPRYSRYRHLARGGQGDIYEAFDERLSRWVAIKELRPDRLQSAEALRTEVALLVELEHPGIVPVHDQGETADGRPWFAMQRISGEELEEVMGRMRSGDRRWTPRRVLDLLVRIAAAVGHAHQRGVVHCDLKPRNVMVGPLGEIWVMDWGIACRVAAKGAEAEVDPRPSGTPGFLAPERYVGAPPDPRADVYGLGAILFSVLTGDRPGVVIKPPGSWQARWPDGADVDAELIALAASAINHDPAMRPADGAAFAHRLTDWLDGARRRDEARALLAEADGLRSAWSELRARAEMLRRRATQLLAEAGPLASDARKRPGRQFEDDAEACAARADLIEVKLVGAVQAALTRAPDLPGAHALLADHYRDVLLHAEAARDAATARRAEALIRLNGRRAHIEWLTGPGRVTLITEPVGARVTLSRYVEYDRRLVAEPFRTFARTPLVAEAVPPGSYLALIDAPGHAPVRCPLRVERGEHWRNALTADSARALRLLPADALESDTIYVPGGGCLVGGDPAALDALPRRRIWIDGFVIDRTAITHRRWLEFLEDVAERYGPAALEGLMPRPRDAHVGQAGPIERTGDGGLAFGVDDDGEPIDPETPVALVDHHAAERYARWRAQRTALPWRLPDDLEWEKAARGVDGRLWPWGDHFDPTLTRVAESFVGRPRPMPVGTCPTDESPFGVRDMAGLIRCWCGSDYLRDGPSEDRLEPRPGTGALRMVRGGAWVAAAGTCRPAGRFANRPEQRFRTIGVRLVRSIEE